MRQSIPFIFRVHQCGAVVGGRWQRIHLFTVLLCMHRIGNMFDGWMDLVWVALTDILLLFDFNCICPETIAREVHRILYCCSTCLAVDELGMETTTSASSLMAGQASIGWNNGLAAVRRNFESYDCAWLGRIVCCWSWWCGWPSETTETGTNMSVNSSPPPPVIIASVALAMRWSIGRLGWDRDISPASATARRRSDASTGAVWGWFTCFPFQVRMCTFPICQRDYYVYSWTVCNGKGSKTSVLSWYYYWNWDEGERVTTLITGISKFPPWLGNIFGRYKRWMMKVVLLCIEQSSNWISLFM